MVGFWEWRCSQYGTYLIPAAIVSIMWQCVIVPYTKYGTLILSVCCIAKLLKKSDSFNFSHSQLHNIWILVCCVISWFNLAWVIKSPIVFWQKWEKYEGHIIQFWFHSDSITYLHSILLLRGVIACSWICKCWNITDFYEIVAFYYPLTDLHIQEIIVSYSHNHKSQSYKLQKNWGWNFWTGSYLKYVHICTMYMPWFFLIKQSFNGRVIRHYSSFEGL